MRRAPFYLPKYFYYIENIAEQYSYITTKVPCEAVLIHERHMRIEISDFVMRAFVPIQRKDSSHAVFFSFGNVSTFRKDGFLRSSMQRCCPSPLSGEQQRRQKRDRSHVRNAALQCVAFYGGCKEGNHETCRAAPARYIERSCRTVDGFH